MNIMASLLIDEHLKDNDRQSPFSYDSDDEINLHTDPSKITFGALVIIYLFTYIAFILSVELDYC